MPLTKKQIGQGLKRCREKYCPQPRYMAAAIATVHPDTIRKRESGETAVTISDLLIYAEAWSVDPVALLAELLHQCDTERWEQIAQVLGCTIPMAKQRLAIAQQRYGLSHGQVWSKYLQEQIRL
ncbi:hypothetical protein Lepto7375DRAFT_7352 [Leptolyngbya sp. PCC 7375]|nr:hypothetical protein Lepto7375DRAFT_7352 [Leptolyngbya sp. PCC 7375]